MNTCIVCLKKKDENFFKVIFGPIPENKEVTREFEPVCAECLAEVTEAVILKDHEGQMWRVKEAIMLT